MAGLTDVSPWNFSPFISRLYPSFLHLLLSTDSFSIYLDCRLKFLVLFLAFGISLSVTSRTAWTPSVIIVYTSPLSPANSFEFLFDRTNEKSWKKRRGQVARASGKGKRSGCVREKTERENRRRPGYLGRAQKLSSKSAPLSAPGNPREVRASAEIIEFLLLDRPLSSRRPPLWALPLASRLNTHLSIVGPHTYLSTFIIPLAVILQYPSFRVLSYYISVSTSVSFEMMVSVYVHELIDGSL